MDWVYRVLLGLMLLGLGMWVDRKRAQRRERLARQEAQKYFKGVDQNLWRLR